MIELKHWKAFHPKIVMMLLLIAMLSACGGKRQIVKTEIVEKKVLELVPVPEKFTRLVWVPELPSVVTYGFMKNHLVPTLYGQIDQCNGQLLEIRNLRIDESD